MDPSSDGERTEHRAGERGHGAVRLLLLGVALAAATVVVSARTGAPLAARGVTVAAACLEPSLALPPGHPPVPGFGPGAPGRGVMLPPGHPPLEGPPVKAPRLPGLAPSFEAPEIVEI